MINVRAVYGITILILGLAGLGGCAEIEPKPFEPSEGHIQSETAGTEPDVGAIPDVVTQAPVLPEPEPAKPLEKYTVVVNEVPVRELLFALARDADLNVDLYPGLEGTVTLNAVDQTLPQILDRISRQINIRYEFKGDNIVISPDVPYFKDYRVDYVNMARDTSSTNRVATQISTTGGTGTGGAGGGGTGGGGGGGGGGGNNNSTTNVDSVSFNRFWQTLVVNISALIDDPVGSISGTGQIPVTNNVIASPETGIINVRATSREHELISQYISQMEESAQRQVLIQATIVEVALNDQYQAGIDWAALDVFGSGIDLLSTTLNPAFPNTPIQGSLTQAIFSYTDTDSTGEVRNQALVRLLEEFGETQVLSSPQLMAMNNQTAILKVVENLVYFEIDSEVSQGALGGQVTSVDTTAQTVPVGIVMTLTPQINDTGVVTLNVRPTISRVTDRIEDPNPQAAVPNLVPQIEVREMESMLRLTSGQVAVLGGLMEDSTQDDDARIPGFSRIPIIGRAFSTRTKNYQKSELVIFLRPVVVNNPSVNADLYEYRTFLRDNSTSRSGGASQ